MKGIREVKKMFWSNSNYTIFERKLYEAGVFKNQQLRIEQDFRHFLDALVVDELIDENLASKARLK